MKQWKKIIVTTMCILLVSQSTAYAAEYTVAANDSLYNISSLFKVSTDKIMADNDLTSDYIEIGQQLTVPALEYTVKSEDTLSGIARLYGVTVTAIKDANNFSSDTAPVGRKLIIPGIKPVYSKSVIPYTKSQVILLARLIEAEASGESYKAKIAVGAVVVNRVQSNEWAPTIKEVIYQKFGPYYQFTPVKNGMITRPASASSVRAAWTALYGSDPSKGAIFYFDDSSTNEWLWSKPVTANIGRMIFAK